MRHPHPPPQSLLPPSSGPSNPYRIRVIRCASGERLPVLLRRADGVPLFLPNAYALSQQRGKAQAANTIERCLRSISVLLLFSDAERIDLDSRIHTGELLSMSELDRLYIAAGRRIEDLVVAASVRPVRARTVRLVSLERYRSTMQSCKETPLDLRTVAVRLHHIKEYLEWRTTRQLARLRRPSSAHLEYAAVRDDFLRQFEARIPDGRSSASEREGLSEEDYAALFATLQPGASRNPWKGRSAQLRNLLLVATFDRLGVRRGELLSILLEDLDLRRHVVRVIRRPDNPLDPRAREPNVKRLEREIPLEELVPLLQHYIHDIRAQLPGARRHPFLFVDLRRGRPLSESAVAKIFSQLRAVLPDIPQLSPHVLRHTWNDRFSKLCAARGVSRPAEEAWRDFLAGWKPNSGTSASYTKRYDREDATRALQSMHRSLLSPVTGHET